MKIVHIASEISPLAKVGGLADVVYGLAKATLNLGHQVTVIIPAYNTLLENFFPNKTHPEIKHLDDLSFIEHKASFEGIHILGIEIIAPKFQRKGIYGGLDETEYFLCFAKIAADAALTLKAHVIHGHDWQASFSLFEIKKKKLPIKSVLTLHNLQYQGKVDFSLLYKMGCSFPLAPWMIDTQDSSKANLLKIGIESADRITTVSKSYHDEILDSIHSFDLDKTLLLHRHKFIGILNGIDYDYFNPFKDNYLKPHFSTKCQRDPDLLKKAKLSNLKSLLAEHQKPFDDRFTLGAVTRLADQKAPFLILYAMKKVLEMGGRFILVGSLHGSQHDEEITSLLRTYEDHPYLIAELNTNSEMAHRTFCSSHAIIIPSFFEPCGLTQMIALRYGCIPLVRATGGLKDTVFDIDTSSLSEEKRNGFTFDFPDEGGIDWVLDRAFKLYMQDSEGFYKLAQKNLQEDHSWEKACQAYIELYEILTLNHKNQS